MSDAVSKSFWLLLAGAVAALAFLPREFHRTPNIRELRLSFLTTPVAETKRAIASIPTAQRCAG